LDTRSLWMNSVLYQFCHGSPWCSRVYWPVPPKMDYTCVKQKYSNHSHIKFCYEALVGLVLIPHKDYIYQEIILYPSLLILGPEDACHDWGVSWVSLIQKQMLGYYIKKATSFPIYHSQITSTKQIAEKHNYIRLIFQHPAVRL
jgi:hypothetical protein